MRTLTRIPDRRNAFGGLVEAAPLDFSDPDGLRRAVQGADVLYDTYWERFARGQTTFDLAVRNTRTLFEAAAEAGVGRIVHFSVANASIKASLPYFRGKGQMEEILKGAGITHAIIRPTLVFGEVDLPLNNPGWALRQFPVFPVFGSGGYPVRPSTPKTSGHGQWRPGPGESFVANAGLRSECGYGGTGHHTDGIGPTVELVLGNGHAANGAGNGHAAVNGNGH